MVERAGKPELGSGRLYYSARCEQDKKMCKVKRRTGGGVVLPRQKTTVGREG